MLQLMPPVCRDCGKTPDEAKLSLYLDFHLCGACIAARERAVFKSDGARRKVAPIVVAKKKAKPAKVAAAKKPAKANPAKKPVAAKRGTLKKK